MNRRKVKRHKVMRHKCLRHKLVRCKVNRRKVNRRSDASPVHVSQNDESSQVILIRCCTSSTSFHSSFSHTQDIMHEISVSFLFLELAFEWLKLCLQCLTKQYNNHVAVEEFKCYEYTMIMQV